MFRVFSKKNSRFAIILLVIVILFTFYRHQNPKHQKLTFFSGEAIGTTYAVKCSNCSEINVNQKVDSLVVLFNQSLSTYDDTSLISRINAGEKDVQIDPLFKKVFLMSKQIYRETGGYFDPSVGILVNKYGFGPKNSENQGQLSISELRDISVGFDSFSLKQNIVEKKDSSSYLDFNGIAKGYLVDLIGLELEKQGVKDYLVEIGGEIKAKGTKKKGKAWMVGIEAPNSDGTRSIWTKAKLNNESMATSGNYRKYLIDSMGDKTVHTINPKTGLAKENELLSVSVIGKQECAYLDAYATALLAMGLKNAKHQLKQRQEIGAVLIYKEKNAEIKTVFINFAEN